MKNFTMRRGIAMGAVTLLLTGIALSSQMDQKFPQFQQQNARALKQYKWKSRMEIQKGGEVRSVKLNLLSYDVDGTLRKTLISSTPEPELPTRGIRGRIAQKKKESFLETLDSLGALAKSYSELPSREMQRFMSTAIVTPEIGPNRKLLRIKGGDVLQPGDSMTLWVDAVTRRLRKIEIQAALERKPVSVVSDFQDLPQGPTYTARSVVDYRSMELILITENFDYERVTRDSEGSLR